MANAQATPRFCIFRPDGTVTPLIALDQLPSWLWVRGGKWGDSSVSPGMVPAVRDVVPRDGEYDAVCYNCFSTIDPLHRSYSERTGPSPPPPAPPVPQLLQKFSRGCYPNAWHMGPESPNACRLPSYRPPGLDAGMLNPVVGMCLVNFPCPLSSPSGSDSSKSQLNPAAPDFDPQPDSTAFGTHCVSNEHPRPSSTSVPVKQEHTCGSRNTDAALAQLKHAVAIVDDSVLSASDISNAMLGVPYGRRRFDKRRGRGRGRKLGKRKNRGIRRFRRARSKRLGVRHVSFRQDRPSRQVNSGTKRKQRREKTLGKNQGQQVHRYWHMTAPARGSQVVQG